MQFPNCHFTPSNRPSTDPFEKFQPYKIDEIFRISKVLRFWDSEIHSLTLTWFFKISLQILYTSFGFWVKWFLVTVRIFRARKINQKVCHWFLVFRWLKSWWRFSRLFFFTNPTFSSRSAKLSAKIIFSSVPILSHQVSKFLSAWAVLVFFGDACLH